MKFKYQNVQSTFTLLNCFKIYTIQILSRTFQKYNLIDFETTEAFLDSFHFSNQIIETLELFSNKTLKVAKILRIIDSSLILNFVGTFRTVWVILSFSYPLFPLI